jgi:hypothetical protein
VAVTGVLTNRSAGTLTVKNLGSTPLQIGDKFTLFSKSVLNGGAITVAGARATWVNNLTADGSVTVATVEPPPKLNFTNLGNSLQFSWSDAFNSFKLQAQTNSLSVGVGTNWADYPGGGTSPVTVPMMEQNETVCFRLISP